MLDSAPDALRDRLWQLKHRVVKWMVRQGFVDSLHVLLQEQLRALQITTVVDVGANRGQYGRLLRRLGFRGRIISFEPVPECFADVSRQARRDGNWEAHPVALGDREGEVEIHVTDNSVFSSLLEPSDAARRLFPGESRVERVETVPLRRLDQILPGLLPPDQWSTAHIKSDAQGYDPAVFEGLGSGINVIPSIQVELSLIGIYQHQVDYQDFLAFLRRHGFQLTALFPVARDAGLRLIEADAVLRRVPD